MTPQAAPVVTDSRYRPDQRVAVGSKGKGTVHYATDPGGTQGGEASEALVKGVREAIETWREELILAVLPRSAVQRQGVASFS